MNIIEQKFIKKMHNLQNEGFILLNPIKILDVKLLDVIWKLFKKNPYICACWNYKWGLISSGGITIEYTDTILQKEIKGINISSYNEKMQHFLKQALEYQYMFGMFPYKFIQEGNMIYPVIPEFGSGYFVTCFNTLKQKAEVLYVLKDKTKYNHDFDLNYILSGMNSLDQKIELLNYVCSTGIRVHVWDDQTPNYNTGEIYSEIMNLYNYNAKLEQLENYKLTSDRFNANPCLFLKRPEKDLNKIKDDYTQSFDQLVERMQNGISSDSTLYNQEVKENFVRQEAQNFFERQVKDSEKIVNYGLTEKSSILKIYNPDSQSFGELPISMFYTLTGLPQGASIDTQPHCKAPDDIPYYVKQFRELAAASFGLTPNLIFGEESSVKKISSQVINLKSAAIAVLNSRLVMSQLFTSIITQSLKKLDLEYYMEILLEIDERRGEIEKQLREGFFEKKPEVPKELKKYLKEWTKIYDELKNRSNDKVIATLTFGKIPILSGEDEIDQDYEHDRNYPIKKKKKKKNSSVDEVKKSRKVEENEVSVKKFNKSDDIIEKETF